MQFIIHHALSLGNTLLHPQTRYTTLKEDEIADLRQRAEYGACEEVKPAVSVPIKKPELPSEDLSVVPGVGAKTLEKLSDVGVTTLSALKAAVLAEEEKIKEILGLNFEKVLQFFHN